MKGDMAATAVMVTGAAGLIGNAVRAKLESAGRIVVPIDLIGSTEEGKSIIVCDVGDIHRLHAVARDQAWRVSFIAARILGQWSRGTIRTRWSRSISSVLRIFSNWPGFWAPGSFTVRRQAFMAAHRERSLCRRTLRYFQSVSMAPARLPASSSFQPTRPSSKLDGVSLRLSWVYGPRRKTDCVVRTMIVDALAGRPTRIPYGQGFHRQYIYVDDAADALVAALDRPNPPRRIYTVTGGTYLTFDELADAVKCIFPTPRSNSEPAQIRTTACSRVSTFRRPRATSASAPG